MNNKASGAGGGGGGRVLSEYNCVQKKVFLNKRGG